MNGDIPPGAVDLRGGGNIPLIDHRILAPAAIEVRYGGLEMPECVAHVRVIDMPRARAYYVPLHARAMLAMRDNFDIVVSELDLQN